MAGHSDDPEGVRAREMNLFRRYFDLVSAGRKTIEVRVRYPNLRRLRHGDHIRFVCGRDDCLTRVNGSPYTRRIYGPEKEALGVLAIEIELVGPAVVARLTPRWWPGRGTYDTT